MYAFLQAFPLFTTMPVEFAPNVTKEYNETICKELNITVPEDYVAIKAE